MGTWPCPLESPAWHGRGVKEGYHQGAPQAMSSVAADLKDPEKFSPLLLAFT